jgi:excisionase family DNA binding protein
MPLTKKQAAEYLNCSVRSIEAYTVKHELNPARSKGSRGDINLYDESELDRIKAKREQVVYVARPTESALKQAVTPQTALQNTSAAVTSFASNDAVKSLLIDVIREAFSGAATAPQQLRHKTLLTVEEAAVMTSLKPRTLLRLIKEKKLKAKKIGNSWRIAPPDLDKLQK